MRITKIVLSSQNALALQSMVESVLKPRVLTASEKVGERSMLLPEGEHRENLLSDSSIVADYNFEER